MLGLGAGLALPSLAAALQPWLPEMVAALLTITALRIGHRAVRGAVRDLRWGLGSVAVLQFALPLCIYGVCRAAGVSDTPAALAAVLATAAPSISGSTNLALLLGQNPGRMMQILVLGTAAFPLTVLPLLLLMPQMGDPAQVVRASLWVLIVIGTATAVGFALRAWVFSNPEQDQIKALDGLSVLAFSAVVVGLMAALNPALRSDPITVLGWAALAFIISYGLQTITYLCMRNGSLAHVAGPLAIGAGNRNIALFLVALPSDIIAPLMVFVGCWQLPMYLTPVLLRGLYKPETNHD